MSQIDESCELCRVVTADRCELVENEETGAEREMLLCEGCWEKIKEYNAGKDVDFGPEIRMRERETSDSSGASS